MTTLKSRHHTSPTRLSATASPRRYGYLLLSALSLGGVVALWALTVRLEVFSPSLLPSPADVVDAAGDMYRQGTLAEDAAASFRRALSGFLVGSALAIVVGTLTGRSRVARVLLEPAIQVVRPIPAIALVPLAILWFGIGEESKLFLTSLGVFFPVWVNTHAGIASTRQDYLRVAACLGAPRHQVFTSVVLPAALPFILTGLRQGIAMSLILIVASEQAGVTEGLGFRLDQARLFSQPDRLFACLLALGIVGALADQVFHRGTRGLVRWATEQS
ncbi:ABC transporter permease [Mycolicibacterium arseniciresistens]|uniref:ABC transporter permease n=1 Tax=Mycolicibacterium arseniciresistens TaxID=3062257 RepID=A0ABT8UHS9_9MYCO|nr:ABC transporter permease [Mycolicibacterium arseniciresistens]MDO3637357.1 ABC transporter permease [Mycolicibacterium arseniciresistens]